MKRALFLLSIGIIAIITIAVGSCSKDEELDEHYYNLDVSSRTPITRSSLIDFEIGDNSGKLRAEENMKYNSSPNCCGINALVDAWINSKGYSYFEQEYCPTTAQQYYDKLINACKNDTSYHWTPDSTSMPLKTFMKLNENFPVSSKKNNDGSIKNVYSYSKSQEFSTASEVNDFFPIILIEIKLRVFCFKTKTDKGILLMLNIAQKNYTFLWL